MAGSSVKLLAVVVVVLAVLCGYLAFQTLQLQDSLNKLQSDYDKLKTNYEQLSSIYSQLSEEHKMLEQNYTSLKKRYSSLESDYNMLTASYQALQKSFSELNEAYAELNAKYEQLEEVFAPVREAREYLKDLATMTSTEGLFSYIKAVYQEAMQDEALYQLWYLSEKPYDLEPRYFTYLIETTKYSGDVVIEWHITGANYYVMVMSMSDFLSYVKGEDYYCIDYSFENDKNPLYCYLETGQMYAFVIENNGYRSIRIYDWDIYEKIEVDIPADLRKFYTVNYYIALNVPYVADIGDEAKPPLKTLSEGGDCEDRAVLVASMLRALGYDPSRIALAMVDTDGNGFSDHIVCLAQLPPLYNIEYLTYDLGMLTLLFTNSNPYWDYIWVPDAMLVPASMVNGSDNIGYFIVLDPPDLTKGEVKAIDLLPGAEVFDTFNIIYAETLENLLEP